MICKRCQMNTVECAGSILAPTSIQCTACGWRPGDDPLKVDAAPQVVAAEIPVHMNPIYQQHAASSTDDIYAAQTIIAQRQIQQILADIQKDQAKYWGNGAAG